MRFLAQTCSWLWWTDCWGIHAAVNSYLWTSFLIAANVNKAAAFKGEFPSSRFNGHTWPPGRQNTGHFCNTRLQDYICLGTAEGLMHLVALPLLLLTQHPSGAWREFLLFHYSNLFLLIPPDFSVKQASGCWPLLSSQTLCSRKLVLLMDQHKLIFSFTTLSSSFFVINVSKQF